MYDESMFELRQIEKEPEELTIPYCVDCKYGVMIHVVRSILMVLIKTTMIEIKSLV